MTKTPFKPFEKAPKGKEPCGPKAGAKKPAGGKTLPPFLRGGKK